MYTMLLLIVLAQPPKVDPTKPPRVEPSKLGDGNTAFPKLKPPEHQFNAGKFNAELYEKEFSGLILNNILPELPKDATLLQQVQYEQVREGLAYLRQVKDYVILDRWDVANYAEYMAIATKIHGVAAELHTTPTGQIRCYEARIILLKDIERSVQIRVDLGNQAPQDRNSSRFYRLQAEADLLKLKESLKDKK